jgi:hypothetical protein
VGTALDAAIDEVIETLSDEQRAEPRFFADDYDAWNAFFRRRYERELTAYDGPPPPPARNNVAGRRRWWSAPGRTLEDVLAHIERGNSPILGMPPSLSRRHGSSWMPRRMASCSSGSASTSRTTVKKEPASTPPTRGRSSGALIIREGVRASSSPAANDGRSELAGKNNFTPYNHLIY